MDVKLLDSVIMAYDIDFAKLHQKEERIRQEKIEVSMEIARIEAENASLVNAESVQRASRSKMLLTLESMSNKRADMEKANECEKAKQATSVQHFRDNFTTKNTELSIA